MNALAISLYHYVGKTPFHGDAAFLGQKVTEREEENAKIKRRFGVAGRGAQVEIQELKTIVQLAVTPNRIIHGHAP
jgi:hypothetical protein